MNKINTKYIFVISMVSAMGGLLFGYDWVVIGGAKPFYGQFFNISQSPNLQGWAMSCALIGCLPGAIISGAFSDRFGRKKLLIFSAFLFTLSAIGTGGLSRIYAFMGAAYYFQLTGWPLLLMVIMAIACYAMSLAPVTWVVLSEIFPNRIRGAAMAVATVSLWLASFLLIYTFPLLHKAFDASGTFWMYGIICVGGLLFIYNKLPETKGKSLEEIEHEIIK